MRPRVYLASSWCNEEQPEAVDRVRAAGFKVYDFRCPLDNGGTGFHWSDIDPEWQTWDVETYRVALQHTLAIDGFNSDFTAMEASDACLLLLPCGRSAHLEAGYFVGARKPLVVVVAGDLEPELMYAMTPYIAKDIDEGIEMLRTIQPDAMLAARETPDA